MSWEVSEQKLQHYLLNVNHPVGGPKARFFLARGFTEGELRILDAALRQHPIDNPIEARQQTDFGLKLTVRCRILTPDGSNPCIRAIWMVEAGASPRLVTAYPSP